MFDELNEINICTLRNFSNFILKNKKWFFNSYLKILLAQKVNKCQKDELLNNWFLIHCSIKRFFENDIHFGQKGFWLGGTNQKKNSENLLEFKEDTQEWCTSLKKYSTKFMQPIKHNKIHISTIDLSYVVSVKSMMEISQNFVAFSECISFNCL